MGRLVSLTALLVLLVAACGDSGSSSGDGDSGTDTSAATGGDAGGAVFAITSVDFDAGIVLVTNVGTEDGSLAGHQICQRPAYVELSDTTLAPGESLEIGGLSIGGLDASAGEAALYSSNEFSNPEAIVSYVQWGSGGGGRLETAVDAGIWPADGAVVIDGATAITTGGSAATDPGGWSAG